jgi:pimeloyl-ACP methyl ester carboxylesterase
VHPLTLTGLSERADNATPETNLDTHVQDVVAHLAAHDLDDVVLAGHSYAGAVVGGVADRVPERLQRMLYVDALVPQDVVSLFDAGGPEFRAPICAARAARAPRPRAGITRSSTPATGRCSPRRRRWRRR